MVLSWVDIGVCVATLVASALIGVYFAYRSQGGSSEYLRGGQRMHVLPVSLSLVASFVSGVTLLGVPSEMYLHGTQFATSLLAFCLMGFTVGTVFVPVYRDLKLESCYQYLELRFDLRVRRIASIMFIISQVLFIPIVIYVPALALSQVTGIGVHMATLVTSIVCIFYTTIGGLRAVVWTDALQTVLMICATLAVLVLGVQKVGGLERVWELCSQGQRIQVPDFDPSPLRRYTFWTVLIGAYVFYVSQCGVGSGYVQRYIAVTTPRDARWAVVWLTIGIIFLVAMSLLMGLVAFAAYHDCDPITSQKVPEAPEAIIGVSQQNDFEDKENIRPESRVENVTETPTNNPLSSVVMLCYPSTPRPKCMRSRFNSEFFIGKGIIVRLVVLCDGTTEIGKRVVLTISSETNELIVNAFKFLKTANSLHREFINFNPDEAVEDEADEIELCDGTVFVEIMKNAEGMWMVLSQCIGVWVSESIYMSPKTWLQFRALFPLLNNCLDVYFSMLMTQDDTATRSFLF